MNRYAVALLPLLLSACTSISGYNASSSYACKAPAGVACDSISGVYANAMHKRLPSQQSVDAVTLPVTETAPTATDATHVTFPLRSRTRVLRLWLKPWEDSDGDLHDQSYVYVRIDDGHWQLDHVQQRIRDAYTPLRPPLQTDNPVAEPLPQPTPLGALERPFFPPLDDEVPEP